jgi:hypothetical protein
VAHLRQIFTGAALLCAVVGFAPGPAHAIDRALCKDDGVTEVPGFASGRDSNGCLMIDPGNGSAPIPFQYETFHKTGTASCDQTRASTTRLDLKASKYGSCRSSGNGHYCTLLVWDTVIDNYLDPGCKNEDVVFFGQGPPFEYLFFKNVVIANGWKCAGGTWIGPNGLSCSSSENSAAHSDGMQVRGQPVNGGWFVMQDSVFVNGYNLHLLQQTDSQWGPTGSDLFQGVEFGRRNSVGAATTWVADCNARRGGVDDDICPDGRANIGTALKQAWFIDVWGTTTIGLDAVQDKIVVVNTGCGKNGCAGSVGYNGKGWPHPILRPGSGPGTCPNGQIGSSPPTYCYRSIEKALADGHTAPPFIDLSPAGWENPPPSAKSRPVPPVLEP